MAVPRRIADLSGKGEFSMGKMDIGEEVETPEIESCSELPWNDYFDKCETINIGNGRFFNCFRSCILEKGGKSVFVFIHGGGHSALSWGVMAKCMKESGSSDFEIFAFDSRGHGGTVTPDDDDLSIETQTMDVIDLIETVFSAEDHIESIILAGHSMGGAVAANVASRVSRCDGLKTAGKFKGLVVIDVVEGTALSALPHMEQVLRNRPDHFSSLEEAIRWSISSRTLRNLHSARLSIPTQLVHKDGKYVWRTDLFKSKTHWLGWFNGLSKTFLNARVAKILILAGTDRLDTDLTIGQMQGKYQLVLLPSCGHVIMEDDPSKTAQLLIQFHKRNRF